MLRPKKGSRKDATVYTEPYWFDESQSLLELYELTGAEQIELAMPVGSLSIAQIESLLRAGVDPHYLAPIAIARLRGGVGANEKAVARLLVELGEFWTSHPYLRAQLEQILQVHMARNPDDDLRPHAEHFLQIA